jgi:hypothetical protein
MKLSTLMIVNTIVAAVFGLCFVFAPGHVTSLYSPEVGVTLRYVGQLFGAALLGFAVLTWVARNAPASAARHAILLALFVGDGVGFVLALIGQLGHVVNALGWSTVVIYLLLTLGFGYFAFVAKPELPRTQGQAM